MRVELLCDPEGGEPTEDSNAFLFKGECREMEERTETFIIKPSVASPGLPGMQTRTFHRTIHGPVFARGTVDDKPVAFVKQRFFWKKELDSIPPFYKWNVGVDSLRDFERAAEEFTMSFNAFYADHENIGYFHVGFYPRRAPGVHPALPIWGTGEWEWRGRFPWASQPKLVNPERGWIANWNNKPAVGWDNLDGAGGGKWGAIQRVSLLDDRMTELLDGRGKARLSDLVDVIRDAATRDARGAFLGPDMLRMAGKAAPDKDESFAQAVEVVSSWVRAGAHRKNADRDDAMDDGAALAIFDRWYDNLVHLIFDDELGEEGFELAGTPVSDYSPATGSSFFFDFSSYVANLFDKKARARFARNYCDNLNSDGRQGCDELVVAALEGALEDLVEEQGEDMSQWTTEAENIEFQELGAGSVSEIPWQNRGTHNHVVEIRARAR